LVRATLQALQLKGNFFGAVVSFRFFACDIGKVDYRDMTQTWGSRLGATAKLNCMNARRGVGCALLSSTIFLFFAIFSFLKFKFRASKKK